jgi:DNA end-binding protein Ku
MFASGREADMARAIWSGSISFGLVNVPVKIFSAVSPKEVRFHMVHDADGARIKQKRICSADGKEVPYQHIAKGYEISPGKYVVITNEELEKFDPESTRTIDIEEFVELPEIDPIYYQSSYYLVPDRGAAKAYSLLFHALKDSNKIGVAKVVLRTKQYLCAVRPFGKVLALSTMLYADEINPQSELEGLPKEGPKPNERELKMAEQLIESLAAKFEPEKYKDEYREKVLALIRQKAEGKQIKAPPAERAPAKVVNLMDALKASLATAKKPASEAAQGERRATARAAKSAGKKRHRASA